jgi:hypothetical protein
MSAAVSGNRAETTLVVLRNVRDLLLGVARNPRETVWAVIRHPRTAALGFAEGDGDMGLTFDDLRDEAYDMGRALRRIGWDEDHR